ncbi:hypothetical protein Tco_0861283 [Tanacetum coccineum]|uniref:RNA-directed DNA polymerase, eukaryota n=1 Tax=Tanacetum coccineum TaxID=301880 RepID=A0ABQ5BHC2_9ASTR
MWGNFSFDYACSLARGRSGGLISMWDPNMFVKEDIWCDDAFVIVKGQWKILNGDYFMINIYGPHEPSAKGILWNCIKDFIHHHSGSFMLFGCLNEEALVALKDLEIKIDSNNAYPEDYESRINLLHEIDKIDNLEALDWLQKS